MGYRAGFYSLLVLVLLGVGAGGAGYMNVVNKNVKITTQLRTLKRGDYSNINPNAKVASYFDKNNDVLETTTYKDLINLQRKTTNSVVDLNLINRGLREVNLRDGVLVYLNNYSQVDLGTTDPSKSAVWTQVEQLQQEFPTLYQHYNSRIEDAYKFQKNVDKYRLKYYEANGDAKKLGDLATDIKALPDGNVKTQLMSLVTNGGANGKEDSSASGNKAKDKSKVNSDAVSSEESNSDSDDNWLDQ